MNLVATLGAVVTSLNRFRTLEAAQIELAKTTEKTKEETQPAVDRFLIEGPKYGTTGKALVGAAAAYASAGVPYDTSIASAELTAKRSVGLATAPMHERLIGTLQREDPFARRGA
ncbi:hypothetical protein [Methylobacterium sp. Leaf91]|uniref:hypothetical protein n=1 Tax=Methylobacterium sp. Leaf91 TaxID=1736247 RepID=UPI0006F36396|nr:hypothetical protein [Methylobacterium sp. Leaf91]